MKQTHTHKSPISKLTNALHLRSQTADARGILNVAPAPMGGGVTGYNNLARLTKYSTIAILAIVILSVIILNIVASYSNTKTQAGAEPTATLATNVNGAASISLSIHSATDSCDTSTPADTDGDICMQIPDGGGLAVGRHTISVISNSYAGYSVTVEGSGGDSTDMVASDFGSGDGASSNNERIKSTNATIDDPATLALNTWGIAIPGMDKYNNESDYASALTTAKFGAVPTKQNGAVVMSSTQATGANHDGTASDDQNIYYGANVEQLFRAGTYSEEVVYTATVNLPSKPTNLAITPDSYEADGCSTPDVTITGNNLESTYSVFIDLNGNGSLNTQLTPADLGTGSASDATISEQCTNLNVATSGGQTTITCTMPRSSYIPNDKPYDVYVITQSIEPGVIEDAYSYTEVATGISVKSTSENIVVDYDENLIPVVYVDYNGNGGGHWESLTKSEIESNTDTWFNYTNKQWANAVTVTKESLSEYQDKHIVIDNNDVMGYWVYIPRYAYEVQRRDAIDAPVDPQNFDIVFQTADEKNTPAPTKSTESSHLDYRNSGINRTYVANSDNTTWATHPAFTWGDTELNGIWVGKFEMTGTRTAPTVKPNQHANISERIGNFYSMARSIGKEDKCNVGGGSSSNDPTDDLEQNSHNLATTKSHMLKNSEWGAITYLAHSKYGAGINTSYTRKSNVSKNGAWVAGATDADGDTDSSGYSAATGCGPVSAGSTSSYQPSEKLNADTIESPTACGSVQKAYNGSIGVLASTTNNGSSDTGQGVYGVYDLAGGVGEYVMGSRTSSTTESYSSSYMKEAAVPPYVDLYVIKPNGPFYNKPDWSSSSSEYYYNYDICTFETCGGTATYETTTVQSVSSGSQSWGGTNSYFVYSSYPWFYRGGYSSDSNASPFYTNYRNGFSYAYYGSRAALLALPAGQ